MALEGEMVDAAPTAAERRMIMKRVYKCEYCYLKNARPCYECSACMSGDDHFRPAKPEKKRTTNADRIRAMSDYELAQMLATGKWTFTCLKCMEFIDGECSMKCDERCLEWLHQPAEGE